MTNIPSRRPGISRRLTAVIPLLTLTVGMLAGADPVPSPLEPFDIGAPVPAGQEVYTCVSNAVMLPHNRFDAAAGGALEDRRDQGRFIGQAVPGDATISLRVVEVRCQAAGVVLRTDAATDGARCAVTIDAEGRLRLSLRATAGAAAVEAGRAQVAVPCDLRLERDGAQVSVWYRPANGAWAALPRVTWGSASTPIQAGLWVAGGQARLAEWDVLHRGAVVPFGGNWGDGEALIDLIKCHTRPFYELAQDKPVATDRAGWPTADFRLTSCESLGLPDRSKHNGTATLVWEGADDAVVALRGCAENEYVLGEKWHPRPGISVQTITYTFPRVGVTGWNSNLHQIAFSKTNGTLRNLRWLRPGYAWDTTEVFHRPALALARHASAIRTMCMTATNNNEEKTWNDRPRVESLVYVTKGWPWELVVRVANTLHRDLWVCTPAMADDAYISKLARLIAFGADANGEPYAGPTAKPVHAPLDPSLKVYVEHSNELWNSGFKQQGHSVEMAKAYLKDPRPTAGYAPTRTETDLTKPWVINAQWHVKRTIDISNLFRQVFGDQAMMSRVRPTLGLQNVSHSTRYGTFFPWVEAQYGKPPSHFLHSICVAPYWSPIERHYAKGLELRDSATVDEFLAHLAPSAADKYKPLKAHVTFATGWGIKTLAYEGGVFVLDDIRRLRPASLTMLKQAYADPRMRDIIRASQRAWFTGGGEDFHYFTIDPGPLGHFNVTNDLRDQRTQVLRGLDDVVTAPLPSVDAGFLIDQPGELPATKVNDGAEISLAATEPIGAKDWRGASREYLLRSSGSAVIPLRLRLSGGAAGDQRAFDFTLNGRSIGQCTVPADPARPVIETAPIQLPVGPGLHTLRITATGTSMALLHSLIFGEPRNTRPQIRDIDSGSWAKLIAGKSRPISFRVRDAESSDPQALKVTLTSDNPALFPAESLRLEPHASEPGRWKFVLVAPEGAQGRANFTLSASDADGATTSVGFQAWVSNGGPQSLTIGKPAGCSALGDPDTMTAQLVNDGNLGTAWVSPPSDDHYVWVDLGKMYDIERVKVSFGEHPPRDFRVLTSEHEPNFYWNVPGMVPIAKGEVTGNTSREVTIEGFGQQLRYLWLWVDRRGDSTQGVSIAELDAYGSEPATTAVTTKKEAEPSRVKELRIRWPREAIYDSAQSSMRAFRYDQFGKEVSVADQAVWSLAPGGVGGTIAVIKGECRYVPPKVEQNGADEIIAEADGMTARHRITVVADARPTLTSPVTVQDPIVVGKPIRLSIGAQHRLGADQLTYTWDLVDAPAGAPWPIFGAENGTAAAATTTVVLPAPGTWRLRCLVTDQQARNAISEVELTATK